MRILVTGAGGMIGGYLVPRLLDEGHEVRAVDVKPVADWWQVHDDADNRGDDRGDMRDARAASLAMARCDQVYALAALMGGIGYIERNRAECMINSSLISVQTLRAALHAGVERLFYSSSACVYAAEKQTRPDITALAESDAWPAEPEAGYGEEKLATEQMLRYAAIDLGTITTRIARYHNVYAPAHLTWEGGKEKAPAAICRKVAEAVVSGDHEITIWGNGEQTRSFMHIDDCIAGTRRIMDGAYPDPLNLGSDELVSINQLVTIVEGIAGVSLRRQYDLTAPKGVAGRNSDNTLITEQLGWAPSIRLAEGLEGLYRWVYDQVKADAYGRHG